MAITFNPLEGTFDVIVPDTLRSGGNPTASVGLSAVNGSATTFLRSDGAPALDVGIVPTWTGIHTFSAEPVFNAGLQLNDDDLITMGTGDDSKLGFDGTNTVLTLVAGSLLVDNTVDQIGIIFRGHSTQTSNITRWQQSDGTVILEIEDDGTINAGDDAVASDSGHAVYSGTTLKAIFGWDESESEMGLYVGGISSSNLELEIAAGKIIITDELEIDGPLNHDGSTVGFYGTAPIAKQTGVAVSAAEIHAALVALGLIAA